MTKCKIYSLVGAMLGTYYGMNPRYSPVAATEGSTSKVSELIDVLTYTAIGYSIGTALCKVKSKA